MHKIFIDGEAGTTGLQIRERLQSDASMQLLQIEAHLRKDPSAKLECMSNADVVVLCLHDAQAIESVALIDTLPQDKRPRIIDASTAHRTSAGWVYGFAEYAPHQAQLIAKAPRVANPGCYATGAIALLHPLVDAGVIAKDTPLCLPSVSGYSGGGRSMIEAYEAHQAPLLEYYGLGLEHKHYAEIMAYGGLTCAPIFVPSVGNFAQGMVVQLPLHLSQMKGVNSGADIRDVYAKHYSQIEHGHVHVLDELASERFDATSLNGQDELEIAVFYNARKQQAVVMARLDNLGKGASGAVVQNLKLMLGV